MTKRKNYLNFYGVVYREINDIQVFRSNESANSASIWILATKLTLSSKFTEIDFVMRFYTTNTLLITFLACLNS